MLSARNLSVRYGGVQALSDVSFDLDSGICFVCGQSGAGKTTLIRAICGVAGTSTGTISLDGIDVAEDPMRARRHISYLPDMPPLYPDLTVEEHLSYRGRLKGLSGRRLRARMRHVMEALDLKDLATRRTISLSAGQRRRVGIADALLCETRLLLLDDPFAGLDEAHARSLLQTLAPVAKHAIVILATHDLALAEQATGAKCLVLASGRLAALMDVDGDSPLSERCDEAAKAALLLGVEP